MLKMLYLQRNLPQCLIWHTYPTPAERKGLKGALRTMNGRYMIVGSHYTVVA